MRLEANFLLSEGSAFYQIWSLAYTVGDLKAFPEYLKNQGYTAVYFTPVFLSSKHGYDTTDYRQIDPRIGTNAEFKELVEEFHNCGIKVVIDGVFNHVGREFFAFQDLLLHREESQYVDWFKGINFDPEPDSSVQYFPNDKLSFSGWEGNFDLVELNHANEQLQNYLIDCAAFWHSEFGIDGIRLDVAYSLPDYFLAKLRSEVNLPMIGEMIHGDYNRILNTGVDSVTDYNLFKAMWSAVVDRNLHELNWTLNKHQEEYSGKNLLTFLDNHDVSRVASHFDLSEGGKDSGLFEVCLALLFFVPGTPCVYYGTELPESVAKEEGHMDSDLGIRPHLDVTALVNGQFTDYIRNLVKIKRENPNLHGFDYYCPHIDNQQMIFKRGENWIGINLASEPVTISLDDEGFEWTLPPKSWKIR